MSDPVRVDDPADPRIADFIGLRDRELRTRAGAADPRPAVFVAEGDPVVERAVRAGYRLRELLIDAERPGPLPTWLPSDAAIYAAGPQVLFAITGFGVHRGCIGVFDRPNEPSPASLLATAHRVVVLERVVNPVNLGVIARSAAAFGIDALLLDRSSVDSLYRRASRVAMGEVFDLPWARLDQLPGALTILVDAGFRLLALTPAPDATPIGDLELRPTDRVALVFGSEGPGLSDEALAACPERVRIPLSGRVDSLNVGAAAAVAFYEITRAR